GRHRVPSRRQALDVAGRPGVEDARRLGQESGDRRVRPVTAFRYYVRVRYAECDAQRVVFNTRYAEYVDVGLNEFLRAAGVHDQFVTGPLDFQLVKQTIEWKAPARFDQVLELSIQAVHLGTTSFTFRTEFRIADVEPVIATVETVYVLVDAKTLTKRPIPDPVREAFSEGAAGHTVDHAGFTSADRNQSGTGVQFRG